MSTSVYFPPRWDKEKLLHASSEDLLKLSDDDRTAMFDSLKITLGPEGFKVLLQEMSDNYKAHAAAVEKANPSDLNDELPPEIRAPFLAMLKQLYPGNWGEWGFVVFRTTFGEDEKWATLRQRWDQIFEDRLKNYDGVSGVDEARRLLRFHWVEDPVLDDAWPAEIAARYRTMHLPKGLSHSLCLSVTSISMASVLDSPMPSVAPRKDREMIPFAVAVNRNAVVTVQPADNETITMPSFFGHFNVAVESLIDELFPVIDLAGTDPLVLGRNLRAGDIWVSGGRFGIHRNDG